jgi:hypothetical protein
VDDRVVLDLRTVSAREEITLRQRLVSFIGAAWEPM